MVSKRHGLDRCRTDRKSIANRSRIGVVLCRFLNYQINVISMSFSWRFHGGLMSLGGIDTLRYGYLGELNLGGVGSGGCSYV